ncbi:MAG: SDR family NAD(P)-dependent oxidoreductase, partial [Bacteroidetes bacterium]
MKSAWNESDAQAFRNDPLKLRVYTSRLLGQEEDLVVHGGGNTSVKLKETNIFGEEEELLYVKGSGWDLATIEAEGFAPVKLSALHRLAQLDHLSDMDMVKYQRMAMTNPSAPNPSVEAILHAIIPFTFVDHTHADAGVTISNTPGGPQRIEELYGPNMLIVPYVMPGFILAKTIYEMTRRLEWEKLDGMILLHHGVFSFDHDARRSYEKMIDIVSKAEDYLQQQGVKPIPVANGRKSSPLKLAQLRAALCRLMQMPTLARLDSRAQAVAFSNLPNVADITGRGPLTPDHIIRTKRTPLIVGNDIAHDLQTYSAQYAAYFEAHKYEGLQQLDPAPRWAVWPEHGTLAFGPSAKHLRIISDLNRHTTRAIYQAEQLGGWKALPQKDLFEVEYWSLEQAKLKKAGKPKPMQGQIALVSGAAGGIGKACVERLVAEGAVVAALDINEAITTTFDAEEVLGLACDVTDTEQLKNAIERTVEHFGGLDLLVSNAGIFPPSAKIADMQPELWQKSLDINLSSHQQLLQLCIPYLELGVRPAVVLMASKNVPAPGPGAGAYSVAKA